MGVGLITRDDANVEMTLYHYPGQQVGIASGGKAHETATKPSVFLWTHIPMEGANELSSAQSFHHLIYHVLIGMVEHERSAQALHHVHVMRRCRSDAFVACSNSELDCIAPDTR